MVCVNPALEGLKNRKSLLLPGIERILRIPESGLVNNQALYIDYAFCTYFASKAVQRLDAK
jgi:hypothetical protein